MFVALDESSLTEGAYKQSKHLRMLHVIMIAGSCAQSELKQLMQIDPLLA